MATSKRKTGAKPGKTATKPATSKKTARAPSAKTGASRKPAAKAAPKAAPKAAGRSALSRDMTQLIDLTPEAAKALVRPRDGFQDHLEPLFALHADHAAALGSLSISLDEARARMARWEALQAEEAAAQAAFDQAGKHLEMVKETRALQASKVWSAMLEIYDKAKPVAKKDSTIAAAIKPFAKFMSTGPQKKNE